MKFELLKPNKIKVVVEPQDLDRWGVTADEMAKNSPETRDIFFEMLRQAEKETGFSFNNARLVVEAAIRSESNELTLFVTKVDSDEEKELFEKISTAIKPLQEKLHPKEKKDKAKEETPSTMIEIGDFEDVVRMCHTMRECMWGTLYSYKDKYYMTMLPSYIPKASEFGNVCPANYRNIVEEHGIAVVKNSAFLTIRNRFDV